MTDKRSDTKSMYTLENSDCVGACKVSVLTFDNHLKYFKPACCKDEKMVCLFELAIQIQRIALQHHIYGGGHLSFVLEHSGSCNRQAQKNQANRAGPGRLCLRRFDWAGQACLHRFD